MPVLQTPTQTKKDKRAESQANSPRERWIATRSRETPALVILEERNELGVSCGAVWRCVLAKTHTRS